jgi:stage II sporulation protein D
MAILPTAKSALISWTEEYSGKEIITLLMKAGYLDNNFYRITSDEIKDKFKSGRVSSMVITAHSDNGNEKIINVDGYTIRNIFKSKKTNGILRSNFFDITPVFTGGELERLTITGKGNGHGVGFCQWGAIAQSRAGKNYQEILSFYFPGTHLEDIK